MAKYNVLCNIPALKVVVGDTIELSDKEADGLVRPGVLELIPSKAPKQPPKDDGKGDKKPEGDGK